MLDSLGACTARRRGYAPKALPTVFLLKNWLSDSNVKIGFPTDFIMLPSKYAFLGVVKIDFRVFEFLGGGNF